MKTTIEEFAQTIAREHWSQASDESKQHASQWKPVGNDFDALAEELGMSDEADLSEAQITRLEDEFAETISMLIRDDDDKRGRAIRFAAQNAAREDYLEKRVPHAGRHLDALSSALGIPDQGNLVGSDVRAFSLAYDAEAEQLLC